LTIEPLPWDGHEASLRRNGLRAEHFTEALGASNTERKMCVRGHSALSAPGFYAYNGMLTSLSSQMCQGDDWDREDPLSMPLLINRARKSVLTVSSGDKYTGLHGYDRKPQSRNPKGELTRELARLNQINNEPAGLFAAPEKPLHKLLKELKEYRFWLALVHYDRVKLEIRCEVSQPKLFSSQGRVNDYYLRIVLPPYTLTAADFPDDDDPNEGFDPIDVDVTRR
jgi:hypothetical protein